jgi:hypothetical protein
LEDIRPRRFLVEFGVDHSGTRILRSGRLGFAIQGGLAITVELVETSKGVGS